MQGSDPNTVICIIMDLSNPNGIKDIDAKVVNHVISTPAVVTPN